jgi:hypothetical protein
VAVDADGIPLGIICAPANRHDSPLLGETLHKSVYDSIDLPEQARVHLDRAYDLNLTRGLLVGRLTQTSPFAENEFRRLMGTRVQATNPVNGHPHDN